MLDLFLRGGWVMYPLLALSVISLAVIVERWWHFRRDIDEGARAVETAVRAVWRDGAEAVETAASYAVDDLLDADERHLDLLSLVAQGAPLLGLLGTVTGMIGSFRAIEVLGSGVQVTALAGGIWEALLTTAFGLVVALPALFAHRLFLSRVERRSRRLSAFGSELIQRRRREAGHATA